MSAPRANTETVLTPFGERRADHVFTVPQGASVAHVGDEIHIIDAHGNSVHHVENDDISVRPAPIEQAVIRAAAPGSSVRPAPIKQAVIRAAAAAPGSSVVPDNIRTNWIAYAYWTNKSATPISSFSATWSVPDAPSADDGQTLFLFISLEPASAKAILHPVLQWGPSAAGGGAYWAVASWYLVGTYVYRTELVQVSTGDSLVGNLTYKAIQWKYTSSFSNIAGTTLDVAAKEQLVTATETLEAFNVLSTDDYPDGSTVFFPIIIRTGDVPKVKWTAVSSDVVTATVNTDGATDASITIAYP